MEYRYSCDVKPSDIWKMAMLRTYKSPVGVVNIIFTLAMIALSFRFMASSPAIIKGLLLFGLTLFPVIQPLATYGMCVKQLEDMPRDMELTFSDRGIHVRAGESTEDLSWKKVKNAIRRKNMIVILSDETHGYMITNRELGQDKDAFFDYLCSKIRA